MSMNVNTDFKVWAKSFDAAPSAGGKTAGSFAKLGTITIPAKKSRMVLLGFLAGIVMQATTAGERGAPVLRFTSSDLGFVDEDFILSKMSVNDPIATNNKEANFPASFIPFYLDKDLSGRSAIDVYVSSTATQTADWNGYVSAIFCNREPPADYLAELATFLSSIRSRGKYKVDAAKAHATADTEVPLTAISVPSNAKELTALLCAVLTNAPTAAEEMASLHRFYSGSIDDFEPQEWVGSQITMPSLGTPVGAGQIDQYYYYPTRFPLPKLNFTLNHTSRVCLALTNAPDVIGAIKYR